MGRGQDGRPDDRSGCHPEEGQRTDDPERPRPARAAEQVRRHGRPDRNEDAATDRLDQARGDQLVEVLRGAGQGGPKREDDERADQEATRAPQVSQPACDRHRHDIDEQVAVDDPARLAQFDPGRAAGRVREIRQDRGQRHGGDHQFEPGEENTPADDRE